MSKKKRKFRGMTIREHCAKKNVKNVNTSIELIIVIIQILTEYLKDEKTASRIKKETANTYWLR